MTGHSQIQRTTNDGRELRRDANIGLETRFGRPGRKADERPARFRLTGKKYSVEAVLDQWYEPESILDKVRAGDGNLYILRQQTPSPDGAWDLVSFREEKRG